MKLQQVNHFCYYFHGPVNIGYVRKLKQGMLIGYRN